MNAKNYLGFILISLFTLIAMPISSQTVDLGCQDEGDAFIGIDRKNWNGGSTALHSEGMFLNFTLPGDNFGPCKKIQDVEISVNVTLVDDSGLDASCGSVQYYINIYSGCGSFGPASCATSFLVAEPNSPNLNSQTLNFDCDDFDYQFGDIFGVDIVPAIGNTGCPNGQSAISSGDIVLEYTVCVEVVIGGEDISVPIDLGPDLVVCAGDVINIDAGPGYDEYDWSPGGETSQDIDVGVGVYELMVTDSDGCTDTDEIEVIENAPIVSIDSDDPDNTICGDEMVELTAVTTENDILWNTSEDEQSINVGPGVYQVVVTDDDNCTAEAMIEIFEHPEPSVDIVADDLILCGDDMTTLTATPGFVTYVWNSGDFTQFVVLGAGLHEVIVTDINGCTANSSVEVMGVDPADAGTGTDLSVCNDEGFYNIQDLLNGEDNGGVWTDLDNSGVDININSISTSFENVEAGDYDFEYTVTGTAPCPDDSVIITITVNNQPDAGESVELSLCSDEGNQDFFAIIGTEDFSGDWTDEDFSGLDLSSPDDVDISGLSPGVYEYEYEIDASNPCSDSRATIELTISNSVDAGSNENVSVCEGTLFDLNTALSPTATQNGDFEDNDATGALSNGIFNTAGLSGQSYSFDYVVGDGGNCGMDESTIEVEVVTAVSAGNDSTATSICIGETLDLFDYIPEANVGGVFEDISMSGALTNNLFNTTIAGSGNFDFNYIIGDDVVCPADSSLISLSLVPEPSIDFIGGASLCADQCSELIINLAGTPQFNFVVDIYNDQDLILASIDSTTSMSSLSIWVCNTANGDLLSNDTLFIDSSSAEWYLTNNGMTDANCFIEPATPDTLFYYPVDNIETFIDSLVCSDEDVIIEGELFNASNPTGTITITSMQACDSIINVSLSFFEPADSLIALTLCPDENIIVNGTTYDIDNPTGSELLIDASVNNCDSMVVINLDFYQEYSQDLTETICEGDSLFLAGDWQLMAGIYQDSLMTVEGCDSIINTELILELCEIQYEISSVNNVCANASDANFCINILNADLPLAIQWNNNDSGDSGSFVITQLNAVTCENNLLSGNYSILILDNTGVELAAEDISITDENSELSINISEINPISCFNASDGEILADISGGSTPYTLNWSPDIGTDPQVAGLSAGTYSLMVIDDESCTMSSEITIGEPGQIVYDLTAFDASCGAALDGEIIVSNISGGTGPYSICIDGSTVDDGGMILGLEANQYNLEIKDANNCMVSELVIVGALMNPTLIDITENYIITQGESVQLVGSISSSVETILWSPDNGISCTDCDSPIFSPSSSQTYQLNVMDAAGCEDMAQVNIVVNEPVVEFLLPNIFTPNNDGINDSFDIILSELDLEYSMQIFDRWGNVVFDGEMLTGSDNGWDGKMDGSFVTPGVYTFFISFETADNRTEVRAGSVTVIR